MWAASRPISPHLAGRDDELAWWERALADGIAAGEGRIARMYGPCGTGKSAAAKAGGTSGQMERRHTESYDDLGRPGDIAACLKAYARMRPLALLIDEVHAAIGPHALQMLVNVAQEVAEAVPFFILLVGAPDLPRNLQETGCTFMGRSNKIGIGLLDTAASMDAIRTPLAKSVWRLKDSVHLSVDDDALKFIAERSRGYPYFLQMWGHKIWEYAAAHGKATLGRDDAYQASVDDISQQTRAFFATRYRAMGGDTELLAAATAVGRRFAELSAAAEDVDESFPRYDQILLDNRRKPDRTDPERESPRSRRQQIGAGTAPHRLLLVSPGKRGSGAQHPRLHERFVGSSISSRELNKLMPHVFGAAGGHTCNCTFVLTVFVRAGLAGPISGRGVAGDPYTAAIL